MNNLIFNKKIIAGACEMSNSSSANSGNFCLVFKKSDCQSASIWSSNIEKLLRIFFTFPLRVSAELLYFPPEGPMLTVFKKRRR